MAEEQEKEELCFRCIYENVCSAKRKARHKDNCEFAEKIGRYDFFPGGSPSRKFCPLCKHKKEKCISTWDMRMLADNWKVPFDDVRKEMIDNRGYLLTEYEFLECSCMVSCNRFEEIE